MPLLLIVGGVAALLGVGTGWVIADGTKTLMKYTIIGGVAYWVFFTPSGQRILKKVVS